MRRYYIMPQNTWVFTTFLFEVGFVFVKIWKSRRGFGMLKELFHLIY